MPAKQYTREEMWGLYNKLPQELREAVFSAETADHIWNSCQRHQIPEAQISQVAAQVGNVLMGLVLPRNLQQVLQKEVKLKAAAAQGIAEEMNRFVFYPLQGPLEQIHRAPGETQPQTAQDIGIATPRHSAPARDDYYIEPGEEESEEEESIVEEPAPKKQDSYREPTE